MASETQFGSYKAKRGNLFTIDPRALTVDWTKNLSRNGEEPPVDDTLIELARDMATRKSDVEDGSSGQINPVTVRQAADGRYEVVLGFRRMRAALWLVESGECPDFQIKYVIGPRAMSDVEAALVNMSENLQREDPRPIQTAHAIQRLTTEYGMTLEQVAGRLKRSTSWCCNLLKLVSLPEPLQKAVADEDLAVSAAVELSKIEGGDAQIEAYNELSEGGERVTAARVKEKSGDSDGKAAKGPLGKLRKFLERKNESDCGSASLADVMLQWLDGDLDDREFFEYWDHTFKMLTEQLSGELSGSAA